MFFNSHPIKCYVESTVFNRFLISNTFWKPEIIPETVFFTELKFVDNYDLCTWKRGRLILVNIWFTGHCGQHIISSIWSSNLIHSLRTSVHDLPHSSHPLNELKTQHKLCGRCKRCGSRVQMCIDLRSRVELHMEEMMCWPVNHIFTKIRPPRLFLNIL